MSGGHGDRRRTRPAATTAAITAATTAAATATTAVGGYYRPVGWGWGWGGGWGWGWGGWGWGWGGGWGWGYPGWGCGWVTTVPATATAGAMAATPRLVPGDWAVVDDRRVSPKRRRVFLDGRLHRHGRRLRRSRLSLPEEGRLPARVPPGRLRDQDGRRSARSRASQIKISEKLTKIPGAKQYGSYDNPEPEGGVQRFWSKERTPRPSRQRPVRRRRLSGLARAGSGPLDGSAEASDPIPKAIGRLGLHRASSTMEPPRSPAPQSPAERAVPGSLFRIAPADAAVYLNDHFVGHGRGAVDADPRAPGASRSAHDHGVAAGHGDPRGQTGGGRPGQERDGGDHAGEAD